MSLTAHADEYIGAWQTSRICDMRSLMAHWDAGYKFAEYGDSPFEIAEDVGVSVTTIYNHIKLYHAFANHRQLQKAAAAAGHFNYIALMREALGLPPSSSPATRVWECAHCHSRELIKVSAED